MVYKAGFGWAVVAAALCVLAGCGAGTNPVTGTVRRTDGEVLRQGTVQFISDQVTASGAIREDGSYRLSSAGEADGAPPGTYAVTFLSTEVGGGYDAPDEPEQQMIHSKYTNPTTSPIQVEVPSGGGVFDFELDPPE